LISRNNPIEKHIIIDELADGEAKEYSLEMDSVLEYIKRGGGDVAGCRRIKPGDAAGGGKSSCCQNRGDEMGGSAAECGELALRP
jgi:hypothetical protein